VNTIGLIFTFVAGAFLISLPRRAAAIPLLMGAAYVTRNPVLEIGPASFTVIRVLVLIGFLRVLMKGEKIRHGLNRTDLFLALWGLLLLGSGFFHTSDSWAFRAGMVWSELGCYFLFRIFIQDHEDLNRLYKALCVFMVPIAMLMLFEKITGTNPFSIMGDVTEISEVRQGHTRARGPFNHPILAGTVGATCFAIALSMWRSQRKHAFMGLGAGFAIVLASTSSGPVMMVFFILFGLGLWRLRRYLNAIRWFVVVVIIALDATMTDPVYFLVARIDIAGGSTGWHRAELIRSSIEHLDEWWLLGTDYTRHWMPTGIPANTRHTDITNHLLTLGVMGGLPLMLSFVMATAAGFRMVGFALRENEDTSAEHSFLIWTLGAILFGHVVNFFSIVLYDQSVTFFYLILAGIGAVRAVKPSTAAGIAEPRERFSYAQHVYRAGRSDSPA